MLHVKLRDAEPGMALALPIWHPTHPGRVLLKGGYELTDQIIDRLVRLGVRRVWVRYPSLDSLTRFIEPELMDAQGRLLEQVTATFQTLQSQANAKLPYQTYCQTIAMLIRQLVTHPQAALFLGDLADHEGADDLMRHSSGVSYLSLLFGLKLAGYLVRQRRHIPPHRAKEVTNLGVGAMLHDIGIVRLDEQTRLRHHLAGDDTDAAWREHPALGYRMVQGHVKPSAATIVLHHHQNFDGSGYAGRGRPVLQGERIHIYTRIVALANWFDRARHPGNGSQQPRPTVAVLNELQEPKVMAKFDPYVVRALFTVVPPYSPGSILRLSDGRWAVAIDHDPSNPCHPTVQIIPDPKSLMTGANEPGDMINLVRCPRLRVVQAEDQDVSKFNFPPPPILRGAQSFTWF